MDPGAPGALVEVLERARSLGFLGPGAVQGHLEHALAWAEVLGPFEGRLLDLGSGAGVPGLALATAWPGCQAVLLDASKRRVAWLQETTRALGLVDRVSAVAARAEDAGRDPELRERFDLVVARAFGPPAATAECGAAFVKVGGRLSVSDAPGAETGRWPDQGLEGLGFEAAVRVVQGGASFVILRKCAPLDERWPRRDGRPHHRPLW